MPEQVLFLVPAAALDGRLPSERLADRRAQRLRAVDDDQQATLGCEPTLAEGRRGRGGRRRRSRRHLPRARAASFPDDGPRRVLDAGCGRDLPFRVPDSARIVGLDVSEDSLAGNDRVDERIIGNVETYPLEERAYDAAVCWWVLEHVSNPKAAVGNLARCLRPTGVLVVAVPNFWSVKALITKLTPHRFHVWIYRRLLGYSAAGEPGHPPFKTYMRFAVAPSPLERLAAANGLLVVARIVYASGREREFPFPFGTVWRVVLLVREGGDVRSLRPGAQRGGDAVSEEWLVG